MASANTSLVICTIDLMLALFLGWVIIRPWKHLRETKAVINLVRKVKTNEIRGEIQGTPSVRATTCLQSITPFRSCMSASRRTSMAKIESYQDCSGRHGWECMAFDLGCVRRLTLVLQACRLVVTKDS